MTTIDKETSSPRVFCYLPDDNPPPGAMLSLGFQQFRPICPTGIPAIVFAAIPGIFFYAIFLIFKTPGVRGGYQARIDGGWARFTLTPHRCWITRRL